MNSLLPIKAIQKKAHKKDKSPTRKNEAQKRQCQKKAHEKIKNVIKGRPKPKPKKKSPKRPQPKLEKRKAQLDTLLDRAHQPLLQNHTNPPPSSRRLPKNRSKNKTKKRKQERSRWRMRTTYSNIRLNFMGQTK